jgi:cell division protein FtsN
VSRDYKGNDRKGSSRSNGGSLFAGILIGLVLGLAVALGVAWYINKMPTPFQPKAPAAKSESPKAAASDPVKTPEKTVRPEDAKPRFDFYKILPGVEEPATDQQLRETKAAARESFYLQAGAFQNAPDADNLKARLALIGVQASIQTTTLPDRGVWHRVRLGPYGNVEELNRTRDTLKKNGIDTTLIKVRDADK